MIEFSCSFSAVFHSLHADDDNDEDQVVLKLTTPLVNNEILLVNFLTNCTKISLLFFFFF